VGVVSRPASPRCDASIPRVARTGLFARGLRAAALLGLSWLAAIILPAHAHAQPLRRPFACDGCIANWFYFDHDATSGLEDWNCRASTYDGHGGTDFQGDFKGWSGLAAEDFQDLGVAECNRVIVPKEFSTLATAEFALAFGGNFKAGAANMAGAGHLGERDAAPTGLEHVKRRPCSTTSTCVTKPALRCVTERSTHLLGDARLQPAFSAVVRTCAPCWPD
jgi:hypothetical protein